MGVDRVWQACTCGQACRLAQTCLPRATSGLHQTFVRASRLRSTGPPGGQKCPFRKNLLIETEQFTGTLLNPESTHLASLVAWGRRTLTLMSTGPPGAQSRPLSNSMRVGTEPFSGTRRSAEGMPPTSLPGWCRQAVGDRLDRREAGILILFRCFEQELGISAALDGVQKYCIRSVLPSDASMHAQASLTDEKPASSCSYPRGHPCSQIWGGFGNDTAVEGWTWFRLSKVSWLIGEGRRNKRIALVRQSSSLPHASHK